PRAHRTVLRSGGDVHERRPGVVRSAPGRPKTWERVRKLRPTVSRGTKGAQRRRSGVPRQPREVPRERGEVTKKRPGVARSPPGVEKIRPVFTKSPRESQDGGKRVGRACLPRHVTAREPPLLQIPLVVLLRLPEWSRRRDLGHDR